MLVRLYPFVALFLFIILAGREKINHFGIIIKGLLYMQLVISKKILCFYRKESCIQMFCKRMLVFNILDGETYHTRKTQTLSHKGMYLLMIFSFQLIIISFP